MQFLDLKKQYKSIKKKIDNAVAKVLDSGVFVGGLEVENLERKIAEFCGVKHGIGVNSGTDALFLSLKALGIGPGDEVITTPFTFFATAEVIANCGARPVFIDIEPKTFNIDTSKIEEYLKSEIRNPKSENRPKAIIPVHLFGQMVDMPRIMAIARKYGLYVIEDAAQAIGATINLKSQISNLKNNDEKPKAKSQKFKVLKTGSIGDCGCFSFFPSKNLGGYGDGGMVITNNVKLAEKIRLLKNHGSSPKEKYLNLILGTNSRLDAIQAAILRVKLKYLEKWNKERLNKAEYYNKRLEKVGDIEVPFTDRDKTHIFHQYTIRVKKRNELKEYLAKKGIPTMIYYPTPLHLQPVFKYLGYKKGDFPGAEKAAEEVLSLPIYPELKKENQDYVIKTIKEFYENKK